MLAAARDVVLGAMLALISFGVVKNAAAEEGVGATSVPTIRHMLRASLGFASGVPAAGSHDDENAGAILTLKTRISDHAPGSDFFGVVQTQFKGAAFGAPAKAIWADSGCHPDRGLPKVTVIGISGTMPARDGEASGTIEISAAPRHIGKLVPADEIVVQRIIPAAGERRDTGSFSALSLEAWTKVSRLRADLQLIVTRCTP